MEQDIQILKKEVERLNTVNHELADIDQDIKRQELMVNHAYDSLQKEKKDVLELDNHTLSKTFMKLTNSYDARKEKEIQEQILAENQFIVARKHLFDLRLKKKELVQERENLKGVHDQYMTLLKEKTIRMQENEEYLKYRAEILQHQYACSFHEQNISTCKNALKTLKELRLEVEQSFGGSVIDLLGVPFVGDVIKYGQMDDISQKIDSINADLNFLNLDSKIDENLKQNNAALAMIDLVADNLISDAISTKKIYQLKERLSEIETVLNNRMKSCRKYVREEKKEVSRISLLLEDYIVHYVENQS